MGQRVVFIGGGHGPSVIARGLRGGRDFLLNFLTPVTDTGGSTGEIVKSHPDSTLNGCIGDLTRIVVSLCPDESFRAVFNDRFFDGHTVRNQLLMKLEKYFQSLDEAIDAFHRLCRVPPIFWAAPVSPARSELKVRLTDGTVLSGEGVIDQISKNPLWNPRSHSVKEVWLEPEIAIHPRAENAIKHAHHIVVCPGDLMTSILAVLKVKGVKEAIAKSSSRITIIVNLMTKPGETHGFGVWDFIRWIEDGLGRKADFLLCNSQAIPPEVANAYHNKEGKHPVFPPNPQDKRLEGRRLVTADLLNISNNHPVHDPDKTAQALITEIFRSTGA